MSKQFEEALSLARSEANRTRRVVVIVQDDSGSYNLTTDVNTDGMDVVQRVAPTWLKWPVRHPGVSQDHSELLDTDFAEGVEVLQQLFARFQSPRTALN